MTSNVRRRDKSCHKTTPNRFYRCLSCDPGQRLKICDGCVQNGDHKNHQVQPCSLLFALIQNTELFCNCGDQTCLISCKNHDQATLEDKERPLYSNKLQTNVFIRLFDINLQDILPLTSKCMIRRVEPGSIDGRMIKTYFENSKLTSKVDIKIRSIWSVFDKEKELSFVDKGFDKIRRMLLWHGTKTKNLLNILDKGFVLPKSSGDVSNGAMFGKGVYFSDRVSKSAQYCQIEGEGVVFLCEVALGSMWREGKATNYQRVPNNFHSIKGVGKYKPDPIGDIYFDENIIVPAGKTIRNTHPDIENSQLNYNEFIVFNPTRILIKFVVQVGLKK